MCELTRNCKAYISDFLSHFWLSLFSLISQLVNPANTHIVKTPPLTVVKSTPSTHTKTHYPQKMNLTYVVRGYIELCCTHTQHTHTYNTHTHTHTTHTQHTHTITQHNHTAQSHSTITQHNQTAQSPTKKVRYKVRELSSLWNFCTHNHKQNTITQHNHTAQSHSTITQHNHTAQSHMTITQHNRHIHNTNPYATSILTHVNLYLGYYKSHVVCHCSKLNITPSYISTTHQV